MSNNQLDINNLADQIIDKTLKFGASECDVIITNNIASNASVRMGKIETVETADSFDIGLRIFYRGQIAAISFNNYSLGCLDQYIEKAVKMAKIAPLDEFNYIPNSSEFSKEKEQDLDLFDVNELDMQQIINNCHECENIMLQFPQIVNSNGADFAVNKSHSLIQASNGFCYENRGSNFSVSASAIAESASGNKQVGYDYHSSVYLEDLINIKFIAENAAKNATEKLDPKKISSCKLPIIFHPKVAKSFLSIIEAAISGEAIYKQNSFLTNKLGQQVANKNINIVEDPFMKRGLSSYNVDCEGIIPKKRNVIAEGVLNNYFLTLASAKKMKLAPTGHAIRGLASNPVVSSSNLYIENGKYTVEELYNYAPKILMITDLFGGGANIITGDYSKGASGLLIENGQVTEAVNEITIASNMKEILLSMIQANDLKFRYGSNNTPTILVPEMTVAGK